MNVKSIEKPEVNVATIEIEVKKDEFEAAVEQAYQKNKKKFFIPGFRKGHAPRKMIENNYGSTIFFEDAINIIYPKAYSQAIEENNLRTVGQPEIEKLDFNDEGGITFSAKTYLYPEVELAEYKGIEVERTPVSVTDEEIEAEIKALQERNARFETVDRPAKIGDSVLIDFEGFIDGVSIEGGKGTNYKLELGSGSFISGFEDQLVGVKSGEEKEIEVTFPEDYAKEVAGKKAVFKIKVNEVKEKILPELDDEFAKDVSKFDTLEALKENLKNTQTQRKKAVSDAKFESDVIKKIVEGMKAEVPPVMIDYEADKMLREQEMNITQQGIKFEDYLNMMGTSVEKLKEDMKESALKRVQTNLALEKIIELENFEFTPEEIENEYKMLSDSYGIAIEKIKSIITEEQVKKDLGMKKAADLVLETAVTVESKETET